MLRRDVQNVVHVLAGDFDLCQIEWLRENESVNWLRKKFAELARIHIRRLQYGLAGIESLASVVVAIRRDCNLG